MVELEMYKENHYSDLNYALNEEQSKFTYTIDYCINERNDLEDRNKTIVTILEDKAPAGFFILDFGNDKLELKNNDSAILLRSLSVNPNTQGKGIGKRSMLQLRGFVAQYFSNVNEVLLSVHKNNISASKLYYSVGFVDTEFEVLSPAGEVLSVLSLSI
ncbi:GNAT family N-acetyltransferase [Flavobacterium sp. KACC 22758]|mgnify:CR=1 FL=1|jgi:ribosomal protein S18 acetylase RimI-like enzyme|uniref:GNAT family N-acetyltransferase n=1 Tax=Flavobacterium sp. KACC 22758 TaxID=3025667 RepID=UPI0023660FA0|nr:GNAT family N-acetyltransferase [Flavobacterium sp. KACC 22758]WDF61915.1 GNAT family N-acetyltransferase [Flavobacterium sp. KACC 22758]